MVWFFFLVERIAAQCVAAAGLVTGLSPIAREMAIVFCGGGWYDGVRKPKPQKEGIYYEKMSVPGAGAGAVPELVRLSVQQ